MLLGEHRWGARGGAHSFLNLLVFAADSWLIFYFVVITRKCT